ncbi:hypothetical protein L1887_34093 [Cichorium endivia]|nr:hypothetical protein L1887_34093 [Cichorium endivia]
MRQQRKQKAKAIRAEEWRDKIEIGTIALVSCFLPRPLFRFGRAVRNGEWWYHPRYRRRTRASNPSCSSNPPCSVIIPPWLRRHRENQRGRENDRWRRRTRGSNFFGKTHTIKISTEIWIETTMRGRENKKDGELPLLI